MLRHDAACCSQHAAYARRQASGALLPSSSLVMLDCVRTPVPHAGCELVIPSQMACCMREGALNGTHGHMRRISLSQLVSECRCDAPTPFIDAHATAAARASTLRLSSAGGEQTSRCDTPGDGSISCDYLTVPAGEREALYQIPLGQAPPAGWPAVLILACWNGGTTPPPSRAPATSAPNPPTPPSPPRRRALRALCRALAAPPRLGRPASKVCRRGRPQPMSEPPRSTSGE